MTGPADSPRLKSLVEHLARGDRSAALALHALICAADDRGVASFNAMAVNLRADHLKAIRAAGRDDQREAGELSMDVVRAHLVKSVLPRLVSDGVIALPADDLLEADGPIHIDEGIWRQIAGVRDEFAKVLQETGEHATPRENRGATSAAKSLGGSELRAVGLAKIYRRRSVVNDVALNLRQGEIVGLLGPNGAGKTTTFYMIVGLIQPDAGQILLDGKDITSMPMYRRSRTGIGYLSQEPSIFRKLTVEDNIVAILETLPLSRPQRAQRLESLLDELKIKHLRHSKAYQLSGGERRRLEITRALVTEPKFMMLDEPFAGVDPIAVNDIQNIVADLRRRDIGVLISDHNVEQTLDIVDRAYIMFDGQVKVGGTVRELVYDETVAERYLGPTLTARLRARFAAESQDVAP